MTTQIEREHKWVFPDLSGLMCVSHSTVNQNCASAKGWRYLPTPHKTLSIWQIGLLPRSSRDPLDFGLFERIRAIQYPDGKMRYVHTTKEAIGPGACHETESDLDDLEFLEFLQQGRQNPLMQPIHKIRKVFEWNGLTWEFDEFLSPQMPFAALLEVEVDNLEPVPELPIFLETAGMSPPKLVTGDVHFSNAYLCLTDLGKAIWESRRCK